MKKTVIFLMLLPLFWGATTPADKVHWVDFNTGFALAQQEGKIAIIDCYTDWCGWCKVMDKKTFTDQSIKDRLNEKYISIKFNPEKSGKYFAGTDSLSGRELLMALSNNKPSGYPTFFFFVPQTKKMFQVPGYKNVADLTAILDNVERYQQSVTLVEPSGSLDIIKSNSSK